MTLTLTPELEALIQQKIESGGYRDAAEVVHEALRRMDDQDRLARLRAAIAIGDAEIARGDVIPWTPSFWDDLDREVTERIGRGEKPDPDVCP